jgi:HIP---CoA ligase
VKTEPTSPRGDLEWHSIPGLVTSSATKYADREAVVDGDRRLTYKDLGREVERAAAALVASDIKPGHRIAIWAPNSLEWILAALGSVSAGAVLVPINTRFKGPEAAYILQKSGARLLFTVEDFLGQSYVEMLEGLAPDTLQRIVTLEGWSDFVADAPGEGIDVDIPSSSLSDIIFTSGTTGRPKGVMSTHGQALRVFEVWSRLVGLTEGDRYLIVNPFFHTFGYKAGILACLMRGATIVPHAVFEAASVMDRIAAEAITVLPGPPTLYQSILGDPTLPERDLSSLRLAVTGAAVVPIELIRRMREELSFETILTAYGLTESTGTATMCRPGDDAETIATTSGRAIPDTEVRVIGPDGEPVPSGEAGEVVIRGYNVMRGYYEDPAATAEAVDADGWLHTGDVGVMDDREYLRITDRLKDMFIVGGFNAYPAEIENGLLAHPAVGQVAVVGAPDERLGEVGVAFVVPRPDQAIDPADLVAWARDRMANYKVPRRVVVVDSLPMNASGKVLKYELRERAARPEGG